MPDPQVVFIRKDVDNPEYQEALRDIFRNEEHPTIKIRDPKYSRITGLASKLDIEDAWKVFYFGSESQAFQRFRSSPEFNKYRMAHLDTD